MPKDEESKEAEDQDLTTELLRQMGLCEDEITAALDLADKIEKTIEVQNQLQTTTSIPSYEKMSRDELIKTIETHTSQLTHFQNVVAPQFILMIKKYKDRVLSLEAKLHEKNEKIKDLSQKLDFLLK